MRTSLMNLLEYESQWLNCQQLEIYQPPEAEPPGQPVADCRCVKEHIQDWMNHTTEPNLNWQPEKLWTKDSYPLVSKEGWCRNPLPIHIKICICSGPFVSPPHQGVLNWKYISVDGWICGCGTLGYRWPTVNVCCFKLPSLGGFIMQQQLTDIIANINWALTHCRALFHAFCKY